MDIGEKLSKSRILRLLQIKNKILVEGGIYHITQRAPGRELLFLEEKDYLYFLHLLKKVSKEFALEVFCFVLMTNHLHLLLRINKPTLDKAMKMLYQKYAFYFNKKYERKGHVFCGVYRAALCNNDEYVIMASIYIHLNPLKAGLCKNLYDYRWSSIDVYTQDIDKSFLKPDFIWALLAPDKKEARKEYEKLLKESAFLDYPNILELRKGLKTFFENFKDKILKKFYIDKKESALHKLMELEKNIDYFRNLKRVSKPRDRKALVYLIEQLRSRGYTNLEIAQRLNFAPSTLYRLQQNIS